MQYDKMQHTMLDGDLESECVGKGCIPQKVKTSKNNCMLTQLSVALTYLFLKGFL